MYRLLIVDDEEIITDGLFEVFSEFMPSKLDICKAYSGKEALHWMARSRIDIVLTDIRMPGMSGLELSEAIQSYWPRCRIIFLTGYSDFDYAYRAIQMPGIRYLLKTEGFTKVTQTVQEIIHELDEGHQLRRLVEQSHEQRDELKFMAQGGYFRHLLQESQVLRDSREELAKDFAKLDIHLDPDIPVVLALGRLSYPEGSAYGERSEMLASARAIWNSFLKEQTCSVPIMDKHGDMLWFLQTSQYTVEQRGSHLIRYLEGTLELIQEACRVSLGLTITFTISGAACEWAAVTRQYERLRQLQQMKIGDGVSMILTDRMDQPDAAYPKEGGRTSQQVEMMAALLEAGREQEFFKCLGDLTDSMLQPGAAVETAIEAYYSTALLLFTCLNRWEMHSHAGDYGKLMRLDEHSSMREGFHYLYLIAELIFRVRRLDERDRATQVIDKICDFINNHLNEDLSLVRLAEIHYFNPSYLSRFFKQERGVNLSDYIDQCRVRKAKELLLNGELKVREVAASVGYDAPHSFTRFFKKTAGMTPQEYRDMLISR